MDYLDIKQFHMTCVIASGSLFLLRGIWMLRDSSMLQARWVKIVPHVVDTLLLTSALIMMVWSSQYPFAQTWLTVKVIGLLLYIVLGTIALKRGRSKPVRLIAFIAALIVFVYIGSVAITKQPLVFGYDSDPVHGDSFPQIARTLIHET